MKAERATATISAYETLVEQFLAPQSGSTSAAIFRAFDYRRVIALLEIAGHAAFRQLAAAWDDHHLYAGHRASAEERTLALYRAIDVAGDARIDTASLPIGTTSNILRSRRRA